MSITLPFVPGSSIIDHRNFEMWKYLGPPDAYVGKFLAFESYGIGDNEEQIVARYSYNASLAVALSELKKKGSENPYVVFVHEHEVQYVIVPQEGEEIDFS